MRTHFSPILINTSHNSVQVLNQINGKIPSSGLIDTETINLHDFCYQCYKHGPDCLFGKYVLRISMMYHIFPIKKLISSQIKINMLCNNEDLRKRSRCDRKIHKDMRVFVDIHENIYKVHCYSTTKNFM